MVKQVVAQERGYFGGEIREPGDTFSIPLEIWNDKKRRPKWCAAPDEADTAKKPAVKAKAGTAAKADPAPEPEAFADAPAPEVAAASEVKAALAPAPDWIAPGTEI